MSVTMPTKAPVTLEGLQAKTSKHTNVPHILVFQPIVSQPFNISYIILINHNQIYTVLSETQHHIAVDI